MTRVCWHAEKITFSDSEVDFEATEVKPYHLETELLARFQGEINWLQALPSVSMPT